MPASAAWRWPSRRLGTGSPQDSSAVMRALDLLQRHPHIDVKVCTPVRPQNMHDVRNIAALVDRWARGVRNRVFYNVFQTFPRAMKPVEWSDWLVSDRQFRALRREIQHSGLSIKITFLSHRLLDSLYVMIFPNGTLVVPRGPTYVSFGKFLEIRDLDAALARSGFAAVKHLRHSRGWQKAANGQP